MSSFGLERVQTARMICERLGAEDAPELMPLLTNPAVARTLFPDRPLPNATEVAESCVSKAAHWSHHGFGMWLLRDRKTGAMIGRGGLQYTNVTGHDEVEVGWALLPERWGEGLATELAIASIEAAFERLALTQLIAYTLTDNVASRRVMEKAGFAHERDFVHAGHPHALYRLRASTNAMRPEARPG